MVVFIMTDAGGLIEAFMVTPFALPTLLSLDEFLSCDLSLLPQALHHWVLVDPLFIQPHF